MPKRKRETEESGVTSAVSSPPRKAVVPSPSSSIIMTCHRRWSQLPSLPFILVVAVAAGLPWSRRRVKREEEEFSSLLCTQSLLLLSIPPLMLPPLPQPPLSCCAAVDLLNHHLSCCWLAAAVFWVMSILEKK
ncbi:hypothetical protein AHAS_Ahas20G0158900 [Arachis hypogaea]